MTTLKDIIGQDVVNAAAKLGISLDLPAKTPEQRREDQAWDFLTDASIYGDRDAIQTAASRLVLAIIDKQDVATALGGLINQIERYGDTSKWFL